MKKIMKSIVALIILLPHTLWAQVTITNKGVNITNTKSKVFINGNYVHDSTSKIANGGTMHFRGDIVNSSDNNMFVTNAGKVVVDGTQPQKISGEAEIDFFKLDLKKASGNLTLQQNINVNDTLFLYTGNINLNGNEINLNNSGEVVNESESKKIYGTTGKIRARRYINQPTIDKNIAGIGIYISSNSNFSFVEIERGHAQQAGNGDTSIYRYFNFIPEVPVTGLIDALKFSYFDSETVQGEYLYKIFASLNEGVDWKNRGGFVDTNSNSVLTTTFSPPEVGKFRVSVFPIESFATCLPNDPNYISAIFLVSTEVVNKDSIKFIQLSSPAPSSYNWNFGDGNTASEYSPIHIYNLGNDTIKSIYQVALEVTNGVCSDTRKKSITVNPVSNAPKAGNLFGGIEYFNIYPNPNFGILHTEVKTTNESDIIIQLYDMQGRILDKRFVRATVYKDEINIENLDSGIYFLKLQVGEELRVLKIVKL